MRGGKGLIPIPAASANSLQWLLLSQSSSASVSASSFPTTAKSGEVRVAGGGAVAVVGEGTVPGGGDRI